MLSKLKGFLPEGKILKNKSIDRKLPQVKKQSKGLRVFILVCFGFAVISGPLSYIKAIKADRVALSNENDINHLSKAKSDSNLGVYDNHKLILFGNDFVSKYINIPESVEGKNKYKETLLNYYADGLVNDDISQSNGYRILENSEYFETVKYDGYSILRYKVLYVNGVISQIDGMKNVKGKNVKTKVNKKQESNVVALLNVPVKALNGKYSVIDNVYFTSVPEINTNSVKAISNSFDGKVEISAIQKGQVLEFLNGFFEKYANASLDDLSYVMANPEGLSDLKDFVEISDFKAYKSNKNIVVKVSPTFKDKGSDFLLKENFTLVLSKKDSNYFVEKLTHTLGGN